MLQDSAIFNNFPICIQKILGGVVNVRQSMLSQVEENYAGVCHPLVLKACFILAVGHLLESCHNQLSWCGNYPYQSRINNKNCIVPCVKINFDAMPFFKYMHMLHKILKSKHMISCYMLQNLFSVSLIEPMPKWRLLLTNMLEAALKQSACFQNL